MRLFFKNLVFTVLVPGAVAVLLPRAILERWPPRADALPPALRAAGLAAVLLGASLYASALFTFAVSGRGTPAPVDPPERLVTTGPYRWTRNPMYVGLTLLLAGEALYFGARSLGLYALGCLVLFHTFVVLYEEPSLRRRFGEGYLTYRAVVPRWLPRGSARAKRRDERR